MIPVAHIPEQEALETARVVVRALGPEHPLSLKWIAVARKFGWVLRLDREHLFSKPV